MALLLPSGGPLYKAVLEALDCLRNFWLLRGHDQGHMLGSPYFPDTRCAYTSHNSVTRAVEHYEDSRKNVWVQTMMLLPFRATNIESEDPEKATMLPAQRIRARTAVRHLTLTIQAATKAKQSLMRTDDECSAPLMAVIAGILATEATAVVLAIIITAIWRSYFAILWLVPLMLKLLSAAAALRRDALELNYPGINDAPQDFGVAMPAESGTFLIITGPPALVLQFFRHNGHPQRSRVKETVQLCILIVFGMLFPFALLCLVAWMPLSIQYT
jgi:hypothetical protein